MNRTKWITAIALVTLTTSLAFAGDGVGRRGGRQGHRREVVEKLNLTDAQKAQLGELRQSFRQENRAFLESARATMQELRDARQSGDTAKAESLRNEVEQNRAHMQQLRAVQKEKFLSLLTPEQRTQLEALKAERKQRRQQ
ncbi:MAG TPA: Spy/CpxP family protein refolding chaperone [Thermoanaerobaculia bacterium]|nr:Spy/CpxP family protein refolding chaperone [Thermoanaerobaculia bacterium]